MVGSEVVTAVEGTDGLARCASTGDEYRDRVTWRGVAKAVGMAVLIGGGLIVLWYGMVYLLFGRPWMRLAGLAMAVAAFRGIILAFDLMWGRPPAFSKRPWDRP